MEKSKAQAKRPCCSSHRTQHRDDVAQNFVFRATNSILDGQNDISAAEKLDNGTKEVKRGVKSQWRALRARTGALTGCVESPVIYVLSAEKAPVNGPTIKLRT